MRALLLLIIILLGTTFVYGQEGTILISTGEGNSYDVARKNALRYAIEKVYGAFVKSKFLSLCSTSFSSYPFFIMSSPTFAITWASSVSS